VSQISDASVIAALRRQMSVAVARQVAAAGNLANLDTPGYRAREVAFADELAAKSGAPDNATFGSRSASTAAPVVREAEGLPARRDGNTVQLDRELLTMGRAAGDFAAAQTALTAKFRLVRYAINEGR
jgi:flagellar basal-body rod protein FlgB